MSARICEVIHTDVSIAKFKALTKTMKQVRFVVSPDNKLHIGHAYHFIHSHIRREAGCYNAENGTIQGYAYCDGTKLSHYIYYAYDEHGRYIDNCATLEHPLLTELEVRGVPRTTEAYEFVS